MTKMAIWDAVSKPPTYALKAIQAGRLKGKTDINPQWRMKALTEVFGPCGIGWKYSIDRLWTESGSGEQVMAFALISLYVSRSEISTIAGYITQWSDAIPGIGGSAMIARESSGLHSSDECFKMAVTDALSVAMKALGVAADIYAGLWDGSKYKDVAPVTNPHSPTDGAIENLPTDLQTAAKDDAEALVSMWESDKYAAFQAYLSLLEGDSEYMLAVWAYLKPHSKVRSGLKAMKAEKA